MWCNQSVNLIHFSYMIDQMQAASPSRPEIFHMFDPHEPLRPGDPRYVECSTERGSTGLLGKMEKMIRLASGHTCQLLSGHRGCGKTTELFRLGKELSDVKSGQRYFVVYCESDLYIDLNDVEYVDVLIAVARQLWADMRQHKMAIKSNSLIRLIDDLKAILTSEVNPNKFDVDMGIGKLGFEIKKNPDNRHLLRAHLRPRATTFLEAINELICETQELLAAHGYSGIVMIVDNLDRVFRHKMAALDRSNLDSLFIDAGEYLRGLSCHMIYTAPPALIYSASGPQLASLFGTAPNMLPMIPTQRRNGTHYENGTCKLIEFIARRVAAAGVELSAAFDSNETIRRICFASGGYERLMMTLVRSARAYVESLPLTLTAAEQAIRDTKHGYVHAIRTQEQWAVLRRMSQSKRIGGTEDYLQLLESFAVLEYLDDDGPWYDVNPILREAREFQD